MNKNNRKPFIFFCDDKPTWTRKFGLLHAIGYEEIDVKGRIDEIERVKKENQLRASKGHEPQPVPELPAGELDKIADFPVEKFDGNGRFRVVTTNKADHFQGILNELVRRGEIPDIVLIDLYHPHVGVDQGTLDAGDQAIKDLKCNIATHTVTIERAWEPLGYTLLAHAREIPKLDNVPIAIYTEQGLTIAGEDGTGQKLNSVSRQNGDWFIKGQRFIYEKDKLRRMLDTKRYADVTRHTLVAFAIIMFIATVSAYWFVEPKHIGKVLTFGVGVASFLLSFTPRFISWWLKKKTRN